MIHFASDLSLESEVEAEAIMKKLMEAEAEAVKKINGSRSGSYKKSRKINEIGSGSGSRSGSAWKRKRKWKQKQ